MYYGISDMSTILSDKPGIRCRKKCQCIFCFEAIMPGDCYDYRTGVSYGDFWQMKMHPECNAYAHAILDEEDYECLSDKSFERGAAMLHAANHAVLKV